MNTATEHLGEENVQKQTVSVGEPVWVQCNGFRCLAYLNQNGEWRAYSSGAKLSDVVKVLNEPSADNY
jgi:hypothetical protein